MSQQSVVRELIKYGKVLVGGPYTKRSAAERFVNSNRNAWLFGIILDQGVSYEKAWEGPYILKQRLGHFNIGRIAQMPIAKLRRAVKGDKKGEAIHRYVFKMSHWFREAARKLVKEYQGDASNIWQGCRTAAEVFARLKEFRGISSKKAHMATRLLGEEGWADFSSWKEINVAPDRHVKRLWKRTGLATDTSTAGILAAAVRLKPDYPGELDYPTWRIGMDWCYASRPDCRGNEYDPREPCPLVRVCPKRGVRRMR